MATSPTVLVAMTPFPRVIAPDASWIAARALMRGHDIHHLPVVDAGGRVLGLVSQRDLDIGRALVGDEERPVRALCVEPLRLTAELPLKEAVRRMAAAGVDAAIVERHGRLAGVLTLSDVGDALLGMLPSPFVDQGGPVA